MFHTMTCLTVICDRCRQSAGDLDDDAYGEPHYRSRHEAVEHLSDWRIDPVQGHALCPGCRADDECATHGHLLDPWRGCGCHGNLPGHRAAVTVTAVLTGVCPLQIRRCTRCHHHTEHTGEA